MKPHEIIELVITTVAAKFNIDWKRVVKPNITDAYGQRAKRGTY